MSTLFCSTLTMPIVYMSFVVLSRDIFKKFLLFLDTCYPVKKHIADSVITEYEKKGAILCFWQN